jgi:UDP-glucose 4-epimerase
LRYFNVYGPNQRFDVYGNVIPIFVFRMLRGEPITVFGDGGQTRDFVNVRDVVRANIGASMALGVTGAFNIGGSRRVTINELVDLLGSIMRVSPSINYCPARAGDVLHSCADTSAAYAAFGFKPSVSLEDGLREYVVWAKGELRRLQ